MPRRYIAVLVLVILVIVFGLIFLFRAVISNLGGSDTNDSSISQVEVQNSLTENADQVSYTVYGKVVGEEDRRAIRITINNNARKLEVLRGYDEFVMQSYSFPNKQSAYDAFVLAIENAGFVRRDTSVESDDRAFCPLGKRYVFGAEYEDGSNLRTWTTSCSSKEGSFKGNRSTIEKLFDNQIPEYRKLVGKVDL